jgi:glutamate N-acetyltransferase / amino-acid N-acetyltransferase
MKKVEFKRVDGGVTAPKGFRAAALRAGIKESRTRDDLALVVSDVPGAVAGTFTTNRVKAACVKLCERHLIWGQGQAIIVNAGNANACTGEQGIADAERMAELTAQHLGIAKNLVFVCSTGTIGIPLPMNKIEGSLPDLVKRLSSSAGAAVAQAIMTTDTVAKEVALTFPIGDHAITIGGMAKGSGMIAPNMATMLAFLTTDACVDARALQTCLAHAVEYSFNRIVVDGDESTNDTVLCVANGVAGNKLLDKKHPAWHTFCHAVEYVAKALGQMIVKDGEGATKFVSVTVSGAASRNDARLAARAVARSPLVKTAWNGGDPNWGRIMAAIGYSGARFQESTVDITFNDVPAVQNGQAAANVSLEDLRRVYTQKEFAVRINLHGGKSEYTVYTCDLSKDYVGINAEYMT